MAELTADDRRILALYEELAHDPLGLDVDEPDPRTLDILREMRAVIAAESDAAAAKLIAWWGSAFADEAERVEWARMFRARAGVGGRNSTMTERATDRLRGLDYKDWPADEALTYLVELANSGQIPIFGEVEPLAAVVRKRLAALEELERAARDCVKGWKIENEASRDALMAALRALDASGAGESWEGG